jgi:histidine triad (HIT) family protein
MSQPIDRQANCPFCQIATGQSAQPLILRTEQLLVFGPRGPINPGHTLIVPIQHVPNLYTLPDELAGPILQMAKRVARVLKHSFAAEGISIRQHNEPAGGQEVFHFHLHVIPRYTGDSERMLRKHPFLSQAEQGAIALRLRASLLNQ